MTTLPNLKDKPFGGVWSIDDADAIATVKIEHRPYNTTDLQEFLQDYAAWMQQGHNIHGIERFTHLAYANGTTEVFDKFYQRHINRRLRLWRGEYFYHQIQARELFKDWAWIEDGDIEENDVLAVSMPFSDTGGIPPGYQLVMEQCEQLSVPVMIDMAYVNLSKSTNFNVDFRCIEVIATSLSKVFPVSHMRIGMRLMQNFVDDTLSAYCNQATPYLNTSSVHLGHRLIKQYHPQWLWDKYHLRQHDICNELGVAPSNCVILGVDHLNKYDEYNRGGKTNRLCFSKHFSEI